MTTPTTTRAVIVPRYTDGFAHLTLEDRAIALLNAGEVLVKIAASPLNPSDLWFVQGHYGFRKPTPCIPGFEGSGTILAVGDGVPEARIGQRVAFFSADEDGAWMEYARLHAAVCFPVPASVTDEQASMMLVNPLTAWALLETSADSPAIIQTAAASALGQMITRLCLERALPAIHIVRRDEQAATLRALGAEHILNSADAGFDHDLKTLARTLNARVCLDAVGGGLGTKILHLMPSRSRLIVYGGLDGGDVSVPIGELIFRDKHIEGFWLSHWLRDVGATGRAWAAVCADIGNTYKSEVRARYPLEAIQDAIADYSAHMSSGKVLVIP